MKLWNVRDVMTTDLVSVAFNTPYREIVDLLAARRISAVPVVDSFGHVVGVVSEADLLRRVEREVPEVARFDPERWVPAGRRREVRRKASGRLAGDLMTSPAVTVPPGTSIAAAARLMASEHVKRLPVVDDLGRLVGIVTRSDLLRVYLRKDAEIRRDVAQEVLSRVLAVEPGQVRVEVLDGVVTLAGGMDRKSAVELAVRLASAVPGVVDVVNRLTFEFDDSDLVASRFFRGHPFSASPFGDN